MNLPPMQSINQASISVIVRSFILTFAMLFIICIAVKGQSEYTIVKLEQKEGNSISFECVDEVQNTPPCSDCDCLNRAKVVKFDFSKLPDILTQFMIQGENSYYPISGSVALDKNGSDWNLTVNRDLVRVGVSNSVSIMFFDINKKKLGEFLLDSIIKTNPTQPKNPPTPQNKQNQKPEPKTYLPEFSDKITDHLVPTFIPLKEYSPSLSSNNYQIIYDANEAKAVVLHRQEKQNLFTFNATQKLINFPSTKIDIIHKSARLIVPAHGFVSFTFINPPDGVDSITINGEPVYFNDDIPDYFPDALFKGIGKGEIDSRDSGTSSTGLAATGSNTAPLINQLHYSLLTTYIPLAKDLASFLTQQRSSPYPSVSMLQQAKLIIQLKMEKNLGISGLDSLKLSNQIVRFCDSLEKQLTLKEVSEDVRKEVGSVYEEYKSSIRKIPLLYMKLMQLNYIYSSPPLAVDNADKLTYTIRYRHQNSVVTREIPVYVRGGVRWDFTYGFLISPFRDIEYAFEEPSEGSETKKVVRTDTTGFQASLLPSAFFHLYPRTGTLFNPAFTVGVSANTDTNFNELGIDDLNLLIGASALFTRKEKKVAFTAGAIIGSITVYEGDESVPVATSTINEVPSFKISWFAGMSINFGKPKNQ